MAHVNSAFVIASSELAISNGQDHSDVKTVKGNSRQADPEEPTTKCKRFKRMIISKLKWSWVFNATVVILLCILILALEIEIIRFPGIGYHCHDPDLSYKYKGDTVRFGYIIITTVFMPVLIIFIVEFLVHSRNLSYRTSWKKRTFMQTLRTYSSYFLGVLLLLAFVELIKSIIGEPRPHFFDTCKPDKMNCTGYISKYKCTNKNYSKSIIRDSNKSFPSGHSAMAWYVAIHMILYVQFRVPPSEYLVVPLLQTLFVFWGLFCSLSRISDRRHHWWDVLVGAIFGIICALFMVKVFGKNYQTGEKPVPVTLKKPRKQDKAVKETRSSNSWYRKIERGLEKSNSSQPPDDKELREVK